MLFSSPELPRSLAACFFTSTTTFRTTQPISWRRYRSRCDSTKTWPLCLSEWGPRFSVDHGASLKSLQHLLSRPGSTKLAISFCESGLENSFSRLECRLRRSCYCSLPLILGQNLAGRCVAGVWNQHVREITRVPHFFIGGWHFSHWVRPRPHYWRPPQHILIVRMTMISREPLLPSTLRMRSLFGENTFFFFTLFSFWIVLGSLRS